MALDITNLTVIRGQDKPEAVQGYLAYRTEDDETTVSGVNYFGKLQHKLFKGDEIWVQHVDADGELKGEHRYMIAIDDEDFIVAYPVAPGEMIATAYIEDITEVEQDTSVFNEKVLADKATVYLDGTIDTSDANIALTINGETIGTMTVPHTASEPGSSSSLSVSTMHPSTSYIFGSDGTCAGTSGAYCIVVGKPVVIDSVYIQQENITIDDTAAQTAYINAPINGKLLKLQATIDGDPGAEKTIVAKIDGTNVANGTITVPNGTAAGTVISASPTADNILDAGDTLELSAPDTGGNTVEAYVSAYIKID